MNASRQRGHECAITVVRATVIGTLTRSDGGVWVVMGVRAAVLALGSNLGDRQDILQGGVDAIVGIEGVRLTGVSPVYESVPAGGPPQPDYLNAVVLADITISAWELLDQLHEVEAAFDRVRLVRWGPRTPRHRHHHRGRRAERRPGPHAAAPAGA